MDRRWATGEPHHSIGGGSNRAPRLPIESGIETYRVPSGSKISRRKPTSEKRLTLDRPVVFSPARHRALSKLYEMANQKQLDRDIANEQFLTFKITTYNLRNPM